MTSKWYRLFVVIPIALVVACGGSDDDSADSADTGSSSSTTDSGAASGELEEAQSRVDAATAEPTDVGVTEPLSKKPEAGKNIAFLQCGVGICKLIGDEMEDAAGALGWKLNRVDQGTTPEQIVAGWERALSLTPKPDAIVTSGVPVVVYQRQLDRAREAGIPVIDYASANPPNTPGIIADILPAEDNEERGRLMADYVATETDGKAKVAFLNVPDFLTLVAEQKAFEAHLKDLCDECSTEVLNFAATDIGTKVPQNAVSHLQSNPDTNFLVVSFDDLGTGVAEAIKAAGLDSKVKMLGQGGGVPALDNIKNDRVQVATIPQGPGQVAWKVIDALARQFNGDSLDATNANLLPIWLQTKETVGDAKAPWAGPPGYQEQFKKLWQVS